MSPTTPRPNRGGFSPRSRNRTWTLLLLVFITLGGCAGLTGGQKSHIASSAVEFLYPDRDSVVEKPAIPHLTLPMEVGVAFVPSTRNTHAKRDLGEKEKLALMERVASDFRRYDFIGNIEIIPTVYLRPAGGFGNLDQIRTMYGVDVMVLLSYDQVQYTDEGFLSLTYWTLVGAYIVQGEKNDTSTMLDAVVYDIASRKMLFRAPGLSQVKGSATPINQSEELRLDSRKGFALAADDLVANLTGELERFQEKVKNRPDEVRITRSAGYTGGGYLGSGFAVLFFCLAGIAAFHDRRSRPQ